MGEVGPIGVWSPELFAEFAAIARSPRPLSRDDDAREQRLLGTILATNLPLIRHMERQLHGPHIDRLGREEVQATVRLAFLEAVRSFDPAKGGIAGWFRWKLRDRFERAERAHAAVIGPRRQRGPDVIYLDELGDWGGHEGEEVRRQLARQKTRQVRRRIFLTEKQKDAIAKTAKVSRSSVHRYAAGLAQHGSTRAYIEEAIAKLKIAAPERRVARDEDVEAAPLSA